MPGISIVQEADGGFNAVSSATINLPNPTTAGNCIVIARVGANPNFPSTGATLGGSADNFALLKASLGGFSCYEEFWGDPNCAGGQTAVKLSAASQWTAAVYVWEVAGLKTSGIFDQYATADYDTGTVMSSGATPGTSQPAELWLGCASALVSSGTENITGPSSPWTNQAEWQTASNRLSSIAGYQITAATGSADYTGTATASVFAGAGLVVTLLGAAAGPPPPVGPTEGFATVGQTGGTATVGQTAGTATVADTSEGRATAR